MFKNIDLNNIPEQCSVVNDNTGNLLQGHFMSNHQFFCTLVTHLIFSPVVGIHKSSLCAKFQVDSFNGLGFINCWILSIFRAWPYYYFTSENALRLSSPIKAGLVAVWQLYLVQYEFFSWRIRKWRRKHHITNCVWTFAQKHKCIF